MWFIGLIVGGIIGAIGDGEGALIGAIVGAIIGVAISQSRKKPAADPKWREDIEGALRKLELRLEMLEQNRARDVAAPTTEPNRAPEPEAMPGVSAGEAPPMYEPAPAARPQMTVADAVAFEAAGHIPASASASSASPDPVIAETEPASSVARSPAGTPPAAFADNFITRWLFGGNTLVRVGMVVLFFGVAFLLKYAAERDLVPIELRLLGVALGGIALLVVGWRLRLKRAGYALMLQGGGIGVLYLTVFGALRLYHLLPAELAFGLLAAIAVFSAALAVLQDSRALAITGSAGGFLAPILASTGGGSHVALFGFDAVLNVGILAIAWYKAWRELNLVGFAFTFLIGLSWGSMFYRPEFFASTEPFLVFFFLLYVAVAVLFARHQAPRLAHYVDGTLVFGTPIVAFGLQTALVRHLEFGAAWSAFALAAFYLALASVLFARRRENLRLLVESFLALGVGFATLAVPLAFEGRLTSAVWAVEGAAIVWVGIRQGRMLARAFGLFLQFAAGGAFLLGADEPTGAIPVLNSLYLGGVMVSVAGLFCSYYLERNREQVHEIELNAGRVLFVWGTLWWFIGGLLELNRHVPAAWDWHSELLFFVGSCAVFHLLWRGLRWNIARFAALALVPLMALVLAGMILGLGKMQFSPYHPFASHAYVGWALGFAVHLWMLRGHEGRDEPWLAWLHSAGFWLLAVVLSWEVGWQIDHYVEGRRVWPLIAWAIVPGAMVALFAARHDRMGWPVSAHRRAYLHAGALPLVVFLLGWVVFVNFVSNGDPRPLPYVPVLNPLDLAQAGALLAVATWFVGVRRALPDARLPSNTIAIRVLGAVLFIVLNGMLLRTLHHYAGVPFQLDAMLRSMLVQAAFSLFWTLLAMAAMVLATRRGLRALWMVGAVLLGVVVVKLFLVDLSSTGTVERVISFISVGVLVIVVGYFAPVPPKSQEKTA
jgi:uncharacterized membrane protein